MQIQFEGLTIKGEFKGLKEAGWGNDFKNYNHHIITIQNDDTKEQVSFDFWCSIAKPRFQQESDLLSTLGNFLDDAFSGSEDYEDFCSNFGYSEDSRKARGVWRACRKASKQALRVIGDEDRQQAILELLEELGHR
jgi:hypothetical protein